MAERSGTKLDIGQLFDALNGIQKSLECTICLELMVEPMKTRCGHSFCHPCIKRVLQRKTASCPLCKRALNRRNVSKDDHLESYIDKFKQLVVATQIDTHIDILSYLKRPRDTKESCSHADRDERKIADPNGGGQSKEANAPSTSREAPSDCNDPRQRNMNLLSQSEFSGLSGVHPLPADEAGDMPDVKCRTWLHTLPDHLPTITNAEGEPVVETSEDRADKSRTRTRQVRKRSANYTAARADAATSQLNKETEARQLGKVGKIDSAASGLKYVASHGRIRANAANKRKRNARRSEERERQEIRENGSRKSSSLTMADDEGRSRERSISGATSTSAANDLQSSADTNWSRVIEVGKEMRPKRRKAKKLDVSIERKKDALRIVEDVKLSQRSKYVVIEDNLCRVSKKTETGVSNLSDKPKSGEHVAIDKDLSDATLTPELPTGADNQEQSFKSDNLMNLASTGAGYVMLEEGKPMRIKNLNTDQVNRIIGLDGVGGATSEDQRREENVNVTPRRRNDPLQLQHRLTVLTPEKLNQFVDEREANRTVMQTPSGKLPGSSLPVGHSTPGPRASNNAQKTWEKISPEFQSPVPGRLSLRRRLGDHRSVDSPLTLPTSDCSPSSRDEGTSKNDTQLSHRLAAARRDLSSQILDEDQTSIKRDTVAMRKKTIVKNNPASVCAGSSGTTSSSIKSGSCGFSVKFMQLGTLIRRQRNVKYVYLDATKRQQSLPAEVQVISVPNMQQSISRSEIELQKSRSIAPSSNYSHHSNSTDVTVIENVPSAEPHGSSVRASNDTEPPSRCKLPKTATPKNDRKKVAIDRASNLTNPSNESIQKKCQRYSRTHQRSRVDDDTKRIRQGSRIVPGTASSIKLLSPDKDSQLRFLAIDSPTSEREQLANSTRRQLEHGEPAIKETNFSERKSLRCCAAPTPGSQEAFSESSESAFRIGSARKRKRTNRISDEEQFAKESGDQSDNSMHSDDDQRTIKLADFDSFAKDANEKRHSTISHDHLNDDVIDLVANEQDVHRRKYKRIMAISNSDTESESQTDSGKNKKRRKKMDDQRDQEKIPVTSAAKENCLAEQDTGDSLRIQSIANKWSNEHNAMRKKLSKEGKGTQRCSPEEESAAGRRLRLSRAANSLEAEKRSNANEKVSGTIESDLFESNSIFYPENLDMLQQMTKASPANKLSHERIANSSNEDIINRVLQIDRSASRDASQSGQTSGEHLLHDNFDEIIARVELPQGMMSQPSRNHTRTALAQQKTSGCPAVTNEPRDITQESPITISSTDDMFEHRRKSSATLPRNIVPGRCDRENVTSHNQRRLRDCTNDGANRKDRSGVIDLTDADDKDAHRKAASREETFDHVDECPQIDQERDVSGPRSADRLLRVGDSKRATAASDESKDNSFEEDTLMNVTQHQMQLQIFEEDLFGIPATRNSAKATKAASRDEQRQETTPGKGKRTAQNKKDSEEHSAEEDDVVENTPERKMKHSGNNVTTAIKSRKNIAMLYASPGPNQAAGQTPNARGIASKKDTPRSNASTPMSRLKMCPLYQSTPKVAHAPGTAITRSDAATESKKPEPTASGSILTSKQLENADRQSDAQKLCFVCSGLTAVQIRHVKEFAERCNANYVLQFDRSVTHVIVNTVDKENVTKSTLKYLQGIAHRKWIVSYRWIEDCDRESKLLDEEPYEATMNHDGTGPRNSRLREKGLFEDFTFLCVGPYVNVTQSQYQDLLLATGATVVDSPEALAKGAGMRGVVIQDNTHDDKTIEYWYRTAKAAPILADWIVECIGHYKLVKLAPSIQYLSQQDFCAIGYPRELVEDEEYSDDET